MRLTAVAVLTATLGGCSRFVWNEEPFTPDPAPVTETIVSATDTTYVLRAPSYYLLASERSILWQREALDAVSWQYRELFGEAPPLIAVRVDSVSRGEASTWRGVPLAVVKSHGRDSATVSANGPGLVRDPLESPAARLVTGPLLATAAAETWLAARASNALRRNDGERGDLATDSATGSPLPAWLEAAVVRILASPGAATRATAEVRANAKRVLPLASLFAARWSTTPNEPRHGAGPIFIPQAVSVLAFMRERDPTIVARLVDDLARGRTVSEVLGASSTLPHDIARLEAEWRKWVDRVGKRR